MYAAEDEDDLYVEEIDEDDVSNYVFEPAGSPNMPLIDKQHNAAPINNHNQMNIPNQIRYCPMTLPGNIWS
jgi:hypothetical protein